MFFLVNTLHPVAELGGNHEDSSAQTQTHTTGQNFLPTVAVTESSMEAFTVKPETSTQVPFIPNDLPDVISVVTFETPLTEEEVEGYTEGTAQEPSDVLPPEMVDDKEEHAEPEVKEIQRNDPADEGGAGPGELLSDGKST